MRAKLALLLLLKTALASKLNVPRVLLPYSSSPPSFSLTSEAGCYSWSTTRPDILHLQPDNNECSASAVSSTLPSTTFSRIDCRFSKPESPLEVRPAP